MTKLDEKDMKILKVLMKDGRKSVAEIAGELESPRSTISDRINKMLREGVIKRFTAVPDYPKLGLGVKAYILVSFRSDGINQHQLAEQIADMESVYEVSLISGEWDIIVKVRASSVEEVGSFVIDKLRTMKGVEKTQTCVCFKTLKES
jgi:Lrp/AsnC family leucine-responsive transcriptional regulator